MDRYLFFSAEAESPAGYYLMEMWNPVEMDFNATHIASEYGDQLDSICIVFICTSEQLLSDRFYPERKYISHKKRFADYRVHIPYVEFLESNPIERWTLTSNAVSRVLSDIQRKLPAFQADKLLQDIFAVAKGKC
jgi:hypothetical protein